MFTHDLILSVLDSTICVIDIEYVVVVTDERICAGRMMMMVTPYPQTNSPITLALSVVNVVVLHRIYIRIV